MAADGEMGLWCGCEKQGVIDPGIVTVKQMGDTA